MYKLRCGKNSQPIKFTDQKKHLKNDQKLKFIF